MSAKRSQITSFFSQNKEQKTNNDFDVNSASLDILSNSLNEIQDETDLCTEMSSLEPSETSTSAPLTSPSFKTPSSTLALPSSPALTSASPTSPSSTLALLTLSSSTSVSPTSLSSTSVLSTSPSSTSKLKCEATYCTSDLLFVPRNQSDLKLSSDKRSCQLGWFLKYQWLTYCKVRNKNKISEICLFYKHI